MVKGSGVADGVGQRTQHELQDLVDEQPADGQRPLAQGAVGDGDSGDGLHVGGESPGAGEFMIDPGHDPLPGGKLGRAAATRSVAGENLFAGGLAEEAGEGLGEVGEECGKRLGCMRHPPNQIKRLYSTSAKCRNRSLSESLKALG